MNDAVRVDALVQRAAEAVAYPATPRLRARVVGSIGRATGERRRPARAVPALAGIAIALGAAVAAVLAVPASREAVADFFGIEGSTVDVAPTIPAAPTAEIDQNAEPSTIVDAAALAGFEPALADAGEPNAVYTVDYGQSTGIVIRYDGFDLWQVDSGAFEGTFGKVVPVTASIQELTVNGAPARWISGGPHFVEYVDEHGVTSQGSSRVVERRTLIWRTPSALYRIETNLELADAVAIAEALP